MNGAQNLCKSRRQAYWSGAFIRIQQSVWQLQNIIRRTRIQRWFTKSALDNIRYGKPGASEDEVAQAARLAEIYDDIASMPEGFNTYVGERGALLSGGQKQRISIARIFLKNPPVLILDEATSALDSVTESRIQQTFDKLARGRTTIIIAHRLSTVRNADRIAVIEDGRIAELGSHRELMEKNGAYAELVRTQELTGHGEE